MSIIRCVYCHKAYFDINENKCPFCKKTNNNIFSDIFGMDMFKDDKEKDDKDSRR